MINHTSLPMILINLLSLFMVNIDKQSKYKNMKTLLTIEEKSKILESRVKKLTKYLNKSYRDNKLETKSKFDSIFEILNEMEQELKFPKRNDEDEETEKMILV